MVLTTGTRLGNYEIHDSIGAGGMGEVYRGRDTKLNRDVALKVLPQAFVLDIERLARFKREAQVLALLNHANIAAIYGVEEASGIQALVLEFVDGPALNERIARGPVAIDEALSIARQIAEALEAAHEQGIIHRDLKPANIKLRPDGTAKVLDFGLAKSTHPDSGAVVSGAAGSKKDADHALSQSPTITTPAVTMAGAILGTAAYMSPEQAKGRPADKRSDIWAFGCVLYEMLAGTRAFEGEDVTETIAAVVRATPDWSKLPSGTPESIRRLLQRCLEKDRKERLPHIGAARLEVKEALANLDGEARPVPGAPVRPRRRGERLAWATGLLIMTVVAAGFGLLAFRAESVAPETRVEIATPPTTDPVTLSISPDGRRIVFAATSNGQPHLWLRSLDSTSARPLSGTDRGRVAFWSADSRSIGFFADGTFKRLDLDTGSVRDLLNAVTS
jgi:hypothetical protein